MAAVPVVWPSDCYHDDNGRFVSSMRPSGWATSLPLAFPRPWLEPDPPHSETKRGPGTTRTPGAAKRQTRTWRKIQGRWNATRLSTGFCPGRVEGCVSAPPLETARPATEITACCYFMPSRPVGAVESKRSGPRVHLRASAGRRAAGGEASGCTAGIRAWRGLDPSTLSFGKGNDFNWRNRACFTSP